jgi:DNA modification methylase
MGGSAEERYDHPTQKPLECMARPVRNHAGEVYDCFLGSGTTLIACESLGRRCYGLEIDPRFCDVICKRWATYTGAQPTLEGDGRSFKEISAERLVGA